MSYAVDFAAEGAANTQGNLQVVKDLAALNNAIKLWMGSMKGERLYHPTKGGVIIKYLLKPMSESVAEDMKRGLRYGLKNDFEPSIIVRECEVTPDYENKLYQILIIGHCPELNSDVYFNDTINSLR